MALLRTRRLAYHTVANASALETFYTVPPGSRAVIRDVRLANVSTSQATDVILTIKPSGGGNDYWIYRGAIDAQRASAVVGDVVLEAGDELALFSATANVRVYVSGAEMPLTLS